MLTVNSRMRSALIVAGMAALFALPPSVQAQASTVCGPAVKDEVAKAVQSVENGTDAQKQAMYDQLYAKYQSCGTADANQTDASFFQAARQCGAQVSNLGSLFYEEMSCVGYDPQRRQFAAPIKIKQVFGFGGAPLPGSREHVLHCVQTPAGIFVPVGHDSVHLADALAGQAPTWQFAVITSATDNLQAIQPMNNTTRNARSILSWAIPPTNCNYMPIWGVALNYRIRLDQ